MNPNLEEKFAKKIVSHLNDGCNDLPSDISAKLEARRNLALNYRKTQTIEVKDSQAAVSINKTFYFGMLALLIVFFVSIQNYINYKADESLDEPAAYIISNPQLSWSNFLQEVGGDMDESTLSD